MKCMLYFCYIFVNKRKTEVQSDCLVVINGTTYATSYRIRANVIFITICWIHWSTQPYVGFTGSVNLRQFRCLSLGLWHVIDL
jgi:hypothetical protein